MEVTQLLKDVTLGDDTGHSKRWGFNFEEIKSFLRGVVVSVGSAVLLAGLDALADYLAKASKSPDALNLDPNTVTLVIIASNIVNGFRLWYKGSK